MSRPKLDPSILEKTKEIEYFQNNVLRPVLKMQHPLFILSANEYFLKRKISFSQLGKEEQGKYINSMLSRDIAYKNLNLGFVIGQFSPEEYVYYRDNSNEFNKRIFQMLKKRLLDSLEEIIA